MTQKPLSWAFLISGLRLLLLDVVLTPPIYTEKMGFWYTQEEIHNQEGHIRAILQQPL